MIYVLILGGPFLNRHGKRYFKSRETLLDFLWPILRTSQRQTTKEYSVVEAHQDIYNYIRIIRIDERLSPSYRKIFPEQEFKRNKIINKEKQNDEISCTTNHAHLVRFVRK